MGITAQSAEEIIVGAGDVYIDGSIQGSTEEDNVFRITREYFSWSPNGVRGPVKGADYVTEEIAEMEFTLPEISGYFMGIMVPGSKMTSTSAALVDTAVTPFDTTLAAAAAAGATNLKVTAITNLAVGDLFRVGTGASQEVVRALTVGTAGAGGTGVDISPALANAQANAAVAKEVDGTYLTVAAAVGAKSVSVNSTAAIQVGDYVAIEGWSGTTRTREVRRASAVASPVVSFLVPLSYAHSINAPVVDVLGTGLVDRITSGTARRLPTDAYHNYEVRIPGLDGREVRFGITDAIASESPEFTGSDDENMKPRITVQGRYSGATPDTAPWYIDKYGPTV